MDSGNTPFSNLFFMKIDLEKTEIQLKERLSYPYNWYRKQNDIWDNYTNFIYNTATWKALIPLIKQTVETYNLDKKELFYYAINRWYNFWSAMAIEHIFSDCYGVVSEKNSKNRLVDFTIQGISFDHKTSVFPKGFNQSFEYAKTHPKELTQWLYRNQSSQQRHHLKNRLFVIVYDKNGEHWKLKSEIKIIEKAIQKYMSTFTTLQLQKFNFTPENETLSDIIWIER